MLLFRGVRDSVRDMFVISEVIDFKNKQQQAKVLPVGPDTVHLSQPSLWLNRRARTRQKVYTLSI